MTGALPHAAPPELVRALLARVRARGVDVFVLPCRGDPQGSVFGEGHGPPRINLFVAPGDPMFAHVLLHEYGHVAEARLYARRGWVWGAHHVQSEYRAEKFALLALRGLGWPGWLWHRQVARGYVAMQIRHYLTVVAPPYLRFSPHAFGWAGLDLAACGFSADGAALLRAPGRAEDPAPPFSREDGRKKRPREGVGLPDGGPGE